MSQPESLIKLEHQFYRNLCHGLIDQVNLLIEDVVAANAKIVELEAQRGK